MMFYLFSKILDKNITVNLCWET